MNSILSMLTLGVAFISPVSMFDNNHDNIMNDNSSYTSMMGSNENKHENKGLFTENSNWMDSMMEDFQNNHFSMMGDYNYNNMMGSSDARSFGCH